MNVLVETVAADPGQTVWTAVGTDVDTGDRILFGGDWRSLLDIHNALDSEPEVVADVPAYAVLRRWAA